MTTETALMHDAILRAVARTRVEAQIPGNVIAAIEDAGYVVVPLAWIAEKRAEALTECRDHAEEPRRPEHDHSAHNETMIRYRTLPY